MERGAKARPRKLRPKPVTGIEKCGQEAQMHRKGGSKGSRADQKGGAEREGGKVEKKAAGPAETRKPTARARSPVRHAGAGEPRFAGRHWACLCSREQ